MMPAAARYAVVFMWLLIWTTSVGEAQLLSSSLQEANIIFEHFSGRDGLPGSAITGIVQDEKGFLWIGTDDGLVRYDGYRFTVYRHDPLDPNSLSFDQVSVLYQDRLGILWIGTNGGGLNRFLPETGQFRRYQHDPDQPNSLSHDQVVALYEDPSGRFWVATSYGGLHLLNRDTGQVSAHYQMQRRSMGPGEAMPQLIESIGGVTGTDRLWLAAGHDGPLIFAPETGTSTPLPLPTFESTSNSPDRPEQDRRVPPVKTLHYARSGAVWIGTIHGLFRIGPKGEETEVYTHESPEPQSLSDDTINILYTDSAGNLWIGTNGGLNRFDEDNGSFIRYESASSPGNSEISAIYEDRSGRIWLGTANGTGLYSFHPERARFQLYTHEPNNPKSLTHNDIAAILEDSTGTLWIGYRNNGLDRIDPQTGIIRHYGNDPSDPDRLPHNNVSTILEDRSGTIWVGTQGGGLLRFNDETDTFQPLNPDRESQVFESPASPERPDEPSERGTPHHFLHPNMTTLYEDRRGFLWIGTSHGGLYRYEQENGRIRQYGPSFDASDESGLSSLNISTIAEDSQGSLWIGTSDGGLNVLAPQTDQIRQYVNTPDTPECLSNNIIWAIHEDHDGTLWIGTSSGLNAFDRAHETFRVYRQQDGLPSDVIYGIQEDDVSSEDGGPYLWLSTGNGLVRFDPRMESFQQYDTSDGLQDNVFNPGADHAGRKGVLYFGGKHGLNAFSPAKFAHNTHVPPLVITEFQLFNQAIRPGEDYELPVKHGDSLSHEPHASPLTSVIDESDEIILSYREDTLAFEFAALDFIAPQKNQYAYIMQGFDEDWTYSGARRVVQYTNLPSGTYIFKVKGSNNDGVWNDSGTAITLTIRPPFWQTWWFRTVVWGTLAGLAAFVYLMRMARIKAQTRKLEGLVQKRTQELHEYTIRLEDEVFERTQAEQNLQETHEELKATFENLQRTQSELVESEKMAALGQLVAGIAHEINTPIGAIRASVGNISQGLQQTIQQLPLLLQQLTSEQQHSFLDLLNRSVQEKPALSSREERKLRRALQRELEDQHIKNAADIADTLVDMGVYEDISSFISLLQERFDEYDPLKTAYHLSMQHHHSRNIQIAVERASKIVFALKRYTHYDASGEKVKANLVEGLDAVLTLYHNQLKRGVEVHKQYEDIPEILCYPDELNQVWTNLVHNAIQAMDGKGRLDIMVSPSPIPSRQGQGAIIVQITDSGHGIPDEVRGRIFEPFFTTRAAGEGSGLGLDICRKIIEKHQGKIEVESEPGRTTFSVLLPPG